MKKKYLLKAQVCAGGSALFGSVGTQWRAFETDFFAKDDNEAREKAKRYSNLVNPELYVGVDLNESASTVTPV